MTDPDLTTVLEEAEHVAEQHDQVARTTDNQAHEYLRYAVLRVLEGEADHLPPDRMPVDGVTVGYGSDKAMCDSWGSSEDWWESVPPQEACTRFRMFFPDDHQTVPPRHRRRDGRTRSLAHLEWCAAACGSYDHRERRAVHYLWPVGHPVEEVLHERLSGLRKPSLRTGAERATFGTGWSPTRTQSHRTISSRTRSVPSTKR